MRVEHPFPPIYDGESTILILGSFPSVRSREQHFFYGHPQNRFWKVTAGVFRDEIPGTIEEKKAFLQRNHIALWDTIRSCEIRGSEDASITDVVPNDLSVILQNAPIGRIFCNGTKSYDLYVRYLEPVLHRKAVRLPSTSPANAAFSLEKLTEAWQVIREQPL